MLVEECEFYDDDVVYRFIFDIESPLPLHKALNLNEDEGCYMKGIEDYMKRISIDSDTKRKYLQLFWKGEFFLSISMGFLIIWISKCLSELVWLLRSSNLKKKVSLNLY